MDTAEIKEFALSSGFDMVGVCDPAALNPPPEFEWVNSLVVLAYASLDETLDANMRLEFDGKKKWSKWIYEIIEARALRLCVRLMEAGFRAVATKRPDLVKAGVLSGLGSAGRNNMLVTETFGPRVRLIAVATDAGVGFDEPFQKELCRECDVCMKACPTGALAAEGFDRKRCIGEFPSARREPLGRTTSSGPEPVEGGPSEELAEEQRRTLKHLTHFVRIQCRDCMASCPLGRKLKLERPGR